MPKLVFFVGFVDSPCASCFLFSLAACVRPGDYRWITAARDPMSRETPYPWLPVSHPRTLVGASCTPRARRRAGAPPTGGPPPTPLRGAGIRCLEGTGNSLSQLRAGGTPCDATSAGLCCLSLLAGLRYVYSGPTWFCLAGQAYFLNRAGTHPPTLHPLSTV